jgi:CBS domain containing-hemolysin-like protein
LRLINVFSTSQSATRSVVPAIAAGTIAMLASTSAHASLFSGDTLDLVADILAWIVLFIAPAIAITVFWLVHILPERIAEKRHHPQAAAIKTLCMLSLFFGGLLWPLAWLWAYSKPVLYKMAYGKDTVVPEHEAENTGAEVVTVTEEVEAPDATGGRETPKARSGTRHVS